MRLGGVAVVVALVCTAACTTAGKAARGRPAHAGTTVSSTTTTTTAPPRGVVFHGSPNRPLVALTFDTNMTDGMLVELDRGRVKSFVNEQAIAELQQLHVPATIFLAG
ncbi:MAG: hypothetical protein JO155_14455, partial [Acidimicrobiia bacterium]|nr:hypothetical protein [Acidimicrobiia bacterium]